MTESMRPEDVPDALVESGAAAHERWHLDHQTDPDLEIYWSTHRAWVQATLAAVLPAHEAMVIARVEADARLTASNFGRSAEPAYQGDVGTLIAYADKLREMAGRA